MRFSDHIMIPFVISLGLFMEAVDTTVINTAIPAMARSLQVNPIDLKIALISYLLSLAIFIPISGWIADKFGIKRVFISALLIFTASSIWCGFATTIPELVIARVIQGLGGSLMLPVGRLILVRSFERHELINTMSRVIMVAALGMMLGPMLGGFITHYLSWHWIFWVNVPVGLVTVSLAIYYLKDVAPIKVHALDKLGFIFFGCGLAAMTFGLSAFSETTIPTIRAASIVAVAVILLVLYFLHSRRIKNPIVKMSLFKTRTFQISILGNLFARFGFGGVPFLLPLLFQLGLGFTAPVSGMLLAPTALGVLLIKPFSFPLLKFLGYKRLLIINTVLVAASLCSFMLVNQHTPIVFIALLTFIFGFLISLQYSGMSSLGYSDLASHDLSAATSIMSTIQQLAQSFGVALSAVLIRVFTPPEEEHFSLTTGVFHHAFIAMGLLTLVSIFLFFRLQRDDGHQMIKKDLP
jgi:EmrB/QacA subfamily drug resistance transporter